MKQDLDLINGIKFIYWSYAHLSYIIFPDDPTKLLWDILIIIALLYVCFVVPYEISFKNDDTEESAV